MLSPQSEEIHVYEGDFDLKREIDKFDLQSQDEALLICDLTRLRNKMETWKKYLPDVTPYYAVKCNDQPQVLEDLVKCGLSFDCASKKEIQQILALGVTPDRIVFANPMKPTSHIQYARTQKVTDGTVDNEFELYKLYKHYPEANLIIRFRSEAKEAQCPLGEKFGCDAYDEATALILLARSLKLNVIGVGFHVGSGCRDLSAYEKAIQISSRLFKFGNIIGYKMEVLDIGGGFPGNDDDMFATITGIINRSIKKYYKDLNVKIIAEPGRFIVASAYTLICKVYSKRELRGPNGQLQKVMYYINDGVYGTFNCILYDHNEVEPTHFKDVNDETFDSLIWGPTCDALDKICDDVQLPNLREGDLIAFPNMGAYTVPIASAFNGFDVPKTYFYIKKNIVDKSLFDQNNI